VSSENWFLGLRENEAGKRNDEVGLGNAPSSSCGGRFCLLMNDDPFGETAERKSGSAGFFAVDLLLLLCV